MRTIEEQKRTCSYCAITFPDTEAFADHFKQCPVRAKAGYIKQPSVDLAALRARGEEVETG